MKFKYSLLLIIFIAAFISSLILTITPAPPICEEGCDIVQTSVYANTLGIKNSAYGVGIFAFMSLITFLQIKKPSKNKKSLIHTGTTIGAIIATYFLYLQYFVLHAYCQYCLVVDVGMLLALIIILFDRS